MLLSGLTTTSIILSMTINYTVIPAKSIQKDLGILIAYNLDWSKHYQYLCQWAYNLQDIGLNQITFSCPLSTRKQLYLLLVWSQFMYCSQLWRLHLLKDIQSLERVQRRATKYILNDFYSDYKTILIKLNLLPLMFVFEINALYFL